MEKKSKPDNNNIGNAGEYYIASILSSKGYVATITLGRAEAYDIIAIRPDGKTIKIQVKTAWYDNKVFRLSEKDEIEKNTEYFYAFVTLKENKSNWDYYVIPAKIVARSVREAHEKWENTPGKKGQKHNKTSMRLFCSRPSKWCPSWFTQELIDKYKNNVCALEKD
ncbi:aspartate ammonia-lyase [Candidatus Pacearchaeota archaeon]|nr:aspartate ammonia-lyase [Candidatus Pacearchaeota archaeon]